MARRYLTPIDLTGLELTNFKVQNLTSNPTPFGAGHTYYNTAAKELRTYNGTAWDVVGGNVISGATNSRPAAGHAGRLFFDTTKSVLFFDNGSAWIQDGITSQDLADAIDNAALGSTDDLNEGVNNLYFTDARVDSAVANDLGIWYSNTTGNVVFGGAYLSESKFVIGANPGVGIDTEIATHQWVLDNSANYISGVDSTNFTVSSGTLSLNSSVTLNNIHFQDSGSDYLTISRSYTGTARITAADDLALRATNDIILYPGNDVNGHPGKAYIHWGDDAWGAYPEREIATIGTTQVLTNKTINDELFFTNPSTIPNDGGIKVNDGTEHFEVRAYTSDLDLFSVSGNITINPSNTFKVTYNNGDYTAFEVDPSAATTYVRNRIDGRNDNGNVTLRWNANSESIEFWSEYYESNNGYIGTDGTALRLQGNTNLQLKSSNGNIDIEADGQVNINNSHLYINNGRNAYISSGMYIGGADWEYDGFLNIKDYNGENLITFHTDGNNNGGTGTFEIKGQINVYGSGPYGNNVGQMYADGDNNFVINANYNNLVLHSDSGNAYMNSVDPANRIIKYSEIAALQSGLDWKQAVNLLSMGNIDLSVPLTGVAVDGHPAFDGTDANYRILLVGQTVDTENGIYLLEWDGVDITAVRAADALTNDELIGAAVFVMEGTTYGSTSWVQSNHYITGFADQTWTQFSGQGTYIAGDGIAIDGQSISVKLDETNTSKSGLKEDGNGLSVKLKTNGLIKSTSDGLEVEVGAGIAKNGNELVIDTDVVVRKYAQTLSTDGILTEFTVTHNLGTEDVIVSVYDTVTKEVVVTDVTNFTSSTVKIGFAEAPADGAYRVVIHG